MSRPEVLQSTASGPTHVARISENPQRYACYVIDVAQRCRVSAWRDEARRLARYG
jgi:hypothetical protein